MSRAKILRLFPDTHMGLGHDGLMDKARKAKININELSEDDLLMFLNRHGDKLKILGAQGRVVGYLRMPNKRMIMKEALQYIPATFGGGSFDYESACKEVLEKRLNTKL